MLSRNGRHVNGIYKIGLCLLSRCNRNVNDKTKIKSILVPKNLSTSSSLNKRISRSSKGNLTVEDDFTGNLMKTIKDPKAFMDGLSNFYKQFGMFREELSEKFFLNSKELRTESFVGKIDMFLTFENEERLKNFVVTTDSSTCGGESEASLRITENGTALFSGVISTNVPKDGNVKYSGFANILTNRQRKSFKRKSTYDWRFYSHLVLKVRGDGRTYMVVLPSPGPTSLSWELLFSYPLCTRGGPYWQITKIPISHLVLTNNGSVLDHQAEPPGNVISRFGITIADGIDGPFKLEIDYVGLERDPFHRNICPYEQYQHPANTI